MNKPVTYLSMGDIAGRLGLSVNTIRSYSNKRMLPAPDALTGVAGQPVRGWLPETIDAWNAARPGHGGRPKKQV